MSTAARAELAPSDDVGIRFSHVNKTHADGTVAIRDLNLFCAAGTTTVLVGPSGCGKTTALRMVNRMVDPTRGQVLIDGKDVAGTDPVALRRRIGYAMQSSGLLPHRSVIDNVATVLRLNKVGKEQSRQRALELMDTVGLDSSLADRYPSQLSGGQQQRVGVARALSADPNILLMDEPFAAVDPLVRAELQQELLALQRGLGKTIIFVTHDIAEAFLLGDQIVVMRDSAEIAQCGTAREILEDPADEFVKRFVEIATLRLDVGARDQIGVG